MKRKVIFIVGSKPDAVFPDVDPDVVYAANGAIARVQGYAGKSKIIGVISNSLLCNINEYVRGAVSQIKGASVDELYVIGFRENKNECALSDIDLKAKSVRRLSRLRKTWCETKCLGLFFALTYPIKNMTAAEMLKFIYHFGRRQMLTFCKTSTGIIPLALLCSEKKDQQLDIYLIGIGFDENSSHFYGSTLKYGSDHILSDIMLLSRVVRRNKNFNITMTDKNAQFLLSRILPSKSIAKEMKCDLKKIVKQSKLADLVRLARATYLRRVSKPKVKGQVQKNKIVALSDGSNPTFFGYHDKTPFSADGTKILAMSITASDTDPRSECTLMKLGYFWKKDDGSFENRFLPFSETATWCWQQGCMLQWHPGHADTQVFFNTLLGDAYGSALFDIDQNQTIREYAYPIYSLDPTARYAATLNFSRLGRLRPGYGYGHLPDTTADEPAPEHDGLFLLDLQSGSRRLLVSLASLAQSAGDAGAQHYVNHATFSPDGKRIVFFHLWSHEGDRGRGLRVCEADALTGEWCEVESERIMSHYCWRDANTFLATTRENCGKWHYTLYDLVANTRIDLGLPFNEDGHPMFHPGDKDVIVTDTYPDRRRDQHLCIVNLETKESFEIATLYSPMRYQGQVRCDLHPRWDREGRYVAVDSTFSGRRSLVIVDIQH